MRKREMRIKMEDQDRLLRRWGKALIALEQDLIGLDGKLATAGYGERRLVVRLVRDEIRLMLTRCKLNMED